jgi:hypothetical protein
MKIENDYDLEVANAEEERRRLKMAGKGSVKRPVDREKWDNSPYWKNREERIKREKEEKKGR